MMITMEGDKNANISESPIRYRFLTLTVESFAYTRIFAEILTITDIVNQIFINEFDIYYVWLVIAALWLDKFSECVCYDYIAWSH